jgi:hypothetical protein
LFCLIVIVIVIAGSVMTTVSPSSVTCMFGRLYRWLTQAVRFPVVIPLRVGKFSTVAQLVRQIDQQQCRRRHAVNRGDDPCCGEKGLEVHGPVQNV